MKNASLSLEHPYLSSKRQIEAGIALLEYIKIVTLLLFLSLAVAYISPPSFASLENIFSGSSLPTSNT